MPITYNKNSKRVNLTKLNEIEIYELVRTGVLGRFPLYFFDCDESDIYCPLIVRHLIEDILNLKDRNEVTQKIRKSSFTENKLAGLLSIKYDSSPSKAVINAYPERNYKLWEFHECQNNYWVGEKGRANGIEATKWLFEEKLKWNKEDIKEGATWDLFTSNGLRGMLKRAFNNSIWECIESTYPGAFKRWEIGEHVPNEYWDIEKGTEALRWLIEERLKWTKEDVKEKLDKQVFIDNDLYGMVQRCFFSSPFLAINSAFPEVYKPWELKKVPLGYWTLDNAILATRWLIEEKLKWSDSDIREKLSGATFKENGFIILSEKFTPYEIISNTYPNRNYLPWELRASTTSGFWNEENSILAIKWLIKEKLKINVSEAYNLTKKTFKDYGISGAFHWFNSNSKELINYI